MEPTERIWGREPAPGSHRVRRAVTVALAGTLLAGGGVVAARTFGKPAAHKKPAAPTVSTSTSAGAISPGRAIGVVTSTQNGGTTTTISTIDASMHVTRCLARDGTVRLLDLSRRVLIFSLVDGLKNGVYSIAIDDCPRAKPRLLASYNRVFGATDNPGGAQLPATTDEALCGSFSGDGTKILLGVQAADGAAGSWIGTSDGGPWRHVSPWVSCRWLDAKTIVANATQNTFIDPIAIDVASGRPEFVADPDALNGIVSHDGRLIFYQRAFSPDASTLGIIADQGVGSTQTVSLEQPLQIPDPGQPLWPTVWNEDDTRLVFIQSGTVSPGLVIYARGALSPVKESISVQFTAAGWFAPNVIWFSTFGHLRFIDLTTEQRTAVALPDDVGLVMIADQRQGDVGAIAVTSDAAPVDTIRQMGIAFRRPPSWRVITCHTLCAVDGYDFRWLLSSRFYQTSPLTFAMTNDPVSTALNTITRSEKHLCSDPSCAYTEDRSSVRLGGATFTKLVVTGPNGNVTYYVGSFGHGTIIVRTTLDDPSEQLVVDSLRAL